MPDSKPKPTHCWFCGEPLQIRLGPGNPRRYCNRQCAAKLRVKQAREARLKEKACDVCGDSFMPESLRVKYCSVDCRAVRNREFASSRWNQKKQKWPETRVHSCGWCGEDVVLPYSSRAYNKFHDECKKQSRRVHNRIKTLRRQNVKTGLRITHEEVAERDNFVCHICQELVDMSLPRTSKRGATLDHVVPITRGGTDSVDNLRLAHWECNVRKSNRFMEELSV